MCSVFWRGVCVLRSHKCKTTFSIPDYFDAIIFAFPLYPTAGAGERDTPTQAQPKANKDRGRDSGPHVRQDKDRGWG